MELRHELCARCRRSTTKLLGFETGVLRCTECGCVVLAKEMVGGSCPAYRTMDEYRSENGG